MRYDDWRRTFDVMDRGEQQWGTRRLVYLAMADRKDRKLPTVAALLRSAGIAKQTFYTHFGLDSITKFVADDEARVVALLEAKEWTWAPYRQGVEHVAEQVDLSPRALLDGLIRTLVEWAHDYPLLAADFHNRPPATAVLLAGDALRSLGGDPDIAESVLRDALVRANGDQGAVPSLSVLHAVRPQIEAVVGARDGNAALDEHQAAVVEVLSEYAQQLLSGEASTSSISSEIRGLLDRLQTLGTNRSTSAP